MRRLARLLFTFCWGLSLVLGTALTGMWARSYSRGDLLRHIGQESAAGSTSYFASSHAGRVSVSRYVEPRPTDPFYLQGGNRLPDGFSSSHWDVKRKHPLSNNRLLNLVGFDARLEQLALGTQHTLVVPYYALVLIWLVTPGFVAFRYARRRRRHAAGLCPACGYDLRATPGRCPECGAAAAEAASSSVVPPA
jgi:hypothetical protein